MNNLIGPSLLIGPSSLDGISLRFQNKLNLVCCVTASGTRSLALPSTPSSPRHCILHTVAPSASCHALNPHLSTLFPILCSSSPAWERCAVMGHNLHRCLGPSSCKGGDARLQEDDKL
ncbi:hypothetical protein GOP47_0003987 [Adiantum capillus-veneris]|uniref:Uncharacterized protein n=1 Tax=Adiantum capillus-veneris TaxID=13818 RepID=A0A9D4V6R0_ADICA|nr:hypothetical protein GOP47_0003987 [Adiantum capillus-veneris]